MTSDVEIKLHLQKCAWSYVPDLKMFLLKCFYENVANFVLGKVTELTPLSLYFLGFSFS